MSQISRPKPIRTDTSDDFAHNTMKVRVPNIIRETQKLNPDYPESIHEALDRLRQNIERDGPIPVIDDPVWRILLARHQGETWLNSEWFFTETYFYRLLIEAVRWHKTGRDPFAPKKIAEIKGEAIRVALEHALNVPLDEGRLAELLLNSLWGNRIDLSYAVAAAHGSNWESDDLLVDDRQAALEHLLSGEAGEVHIVMDNAGTELAMDFALVDGLLDGVAERVILHVKRHPTFVSDATYDDVLTFLAEMTGRGDISKGFGDAGKEVGTRLQAALLDGRLLVEPDIYWNSAWFLWEMPPRFESFFAHAALVIFKGDANYRRIVGDAKWSPETPFAEVVSYFPAPLLALRTLKSNPIVGLAAGEAEKLNQTDNEWRVNGRRGVAQFAAK
ncbi:MAG: damage-control phosphatase ARMT1 family protein [Chloroflexota bacterium]